MHILPPKDNCLLLCMSVFTFKEENISFLKNPTMESCKQRIGDAPYWTIHGRICYHNHPEPVYIIHHNVPVEAEDAKEWYKDFLHVHPNKTLYAMSHYSLSELKEMCEKLHLSTGKKKDMYERIKHLMSTTLI